MTIKLRFALLLGGLLLVFLGGLMLLQHMETIAYRDAREASRRERTAILERWLELSGQNLRQFANDYSLWDDMRTFVGQPSEEWARINLEASLANFDAEALWVLQPDGTVVYATSRPEGPPPAPPLQPAEVRALTARERFPWFFAESARGLLELRLAPIQASDDIQRAGPADGWLLVARRWDAAHLQDLGRLTGGRARLAPPGPEAPGPEDADSLALPRILPDWRGQPLRLLQVIQPAPEVVGLRLANARETQIFIGFGFVVIVLLGLCLHAWVLRPLGQLEASLALSQPGPVEDLRRQSHEFGRLAQLAAASFQHQCALEREIEERRRIEEALRQSENTLRGAIEERVRLGRDLHDSVIQTIYASGLGLAGLRHLLHRDPAEAERRLEQIRHTLNDTIRELRDFITGLEPEARLDRSLREGVHGLLEVFRTAAPIETILDLDESVAARLEPAARADLLQIVREALSNVLRHGQATMVTVMFREVDGAGLLLVADDGRGFDPLHPPARGQGLPNMEERARVSGLSFELDTAPGKGTRVSVRFPLTGSPR